MLIAASKDMTATAGNLVLIETIFGYALWHMIGWLWDRVAQAIAWIRRSEPEPVRIEPTFDAPFSEARENGVPLLGRRSSGKSVFDR
jgi:hypothetical protein